MQRGKNCKIHYGALMRGAKLWRTFQTINREIRLSLQNRRDTMPTRPIPGLVQVHRRLRGSVQSAGETVHLL